MARSVLVALSLAPVPASPVALVPTQPNQPRDGKAAFRGRLHDQERGSNRQSSYQRRIQADAALVQNFLEKHWHDHQAAMAFYSELELESAVDTASRESIP
jgi:hypothetical protein